MAILPSGAIDGVWLDHQYDVRASVEDVDQYLRRYRALSDIALATYPVHRSVPYGPGAKETVDIFPAASAGAPVFFFIHGGYWRALSKADSAFMVPALTQAGACVVVVEYDLVPTVDLDGIVQQVRQALAWTYRHVAAFGGDPNRLFAAGNSAGGHLLGMLLSNDWQARLGVSTQILRGAVAISGLFDLQPLMHTFVNEWMRLSDVDARRNSPLHHVPAQSDTKLLLCYGGLESEAFAHQSAAYLAAWQAMGLLGESLVSPERNHFDVVLDLGDTQSAVFKAVHRLMELPGQG
ncbi:alpha/beta hydrolase [Enterobacterales bacterium AW_CKDN230030176-1A_HGKHYDSX7]